MLMKSRPQVSPFRKRNEDPSFFFCFFLHSNLSLETEAAAEHILLAVLEFDIDTAEVFGGSYLASVFDERRPRTKA